MKKKFAIQHYYNSYWTLLHAGETDKNTAISVETKDGWYWIVITATPAKKDNVRITYHTKGPGPVTHLWSSTEEPTEEAVFEHFSKLVADKLMGDRSDDVP